MYTVIIMIITEIIINVSKTNYNNYIYIYSNIYEKTINIIIKIQ